MSEQRGWVSIHRKIIEKGWYRHSEYVHLWLHILLKANHKETEMLWNGKIIKIKRGQFITGRKSLSIETGVSQSKVQRALKCFESEQQIEQQMYSKYRLITVKNYEEYQNVEQQNAQQMNSKRTASEQQVNTNNNDNKGNNENNDNKLVPSDDGGYKLDTIGIPVVDAGKDSIGKDRLVKDRIEKSRFAPPSLEQVTSYCLERNNKINPETFIDFYASKGWKVGSQPMKDWQACVRTWEKRDTQPSNSKNITTNLSKYDKLN